MSVRLRSLDHLEIEGKRVLVRADLNVPIADGKVSNDARLIAVLPTIKTLIERRATVILMSHLGRPTPGCFDAAFSLAPVADHLSSLLSTPVTFVSDWDAKLEAAPGEIVLMENVRFLEGETDNKPALAQKMAALADVFVMDAFGTAHRAHASTVGVGAYVSAACAGPLVCSEIDALNQVLAAPKKPLVAIVGGSKVSSKLKVLRALIEKVDALIVGGGIANTFIAAQGHKVGKSLYEPDLITEAQSLMQQADSRGVKIVIPEDVVVATDMTNTAVTQTVSIDAVPVDHAIFDIGPKTADAIDAVLLNAGTILWNGPVGVFECTPFATGTERLSHAVAKSSAFSVAGGGDTLAAIATYDIADKVGYISTGGGAFLAFVEGEPLPAIAALAV